jgi:serine/threonine protein kinase/formylglycine-generating enzyme required for sulfatase activity
VGVGQVLSGHYLLERVLGEGGMGIVFLASDQDVKGELFAIKVLKPEIRERPDALELVREEVRKTRSMAHPNIVGVYSVNIDRHNVYILMEYLEGKTLNALLDDDFGRGMPFSRAWPLIEDICSGLAHAHDHSVIHSDLKPANIFVTAAGRAKLLDFGIARAARGAAGRYDTAALGGLTTGYASCEMLEGRGEPDQRDDVYSLGCVIYEMLSGKHPFDCPSALEARNDATPVEPIPALTDRQNAVLVQTLAFERAKRTPSVEAVLAGLDPGNSPPAPIPPRPYAIWSGVVLLLCAVALGAAWYRGVNPGSSRKVPPAPPPPPATLAPSRPPLTFDDVRALRERALALEIDPDDPRLQQGAERLAAAQQRLAKGATAEIQGFLEAAQKALVTAIHGGKRLAHVGSSADEVALAIAWCRSSGAKCTAQDFSDESPRTVLLDPYELDETEVTNREFQQFVEANHYLTRAERDHGLYEITGSAAQGMRDRGIFRNNESWKTFRGSLTTMGVNAGDYPVRGLDFSAANDFCQWRNQRLPTETEWEYAARGFDHRIFAWGNEPRTPLPDAHRVFKPTEEQPITGPFGNRGLGDGLLEWTTTENPRQPVLRGSSWLDTDPVHQRLVFRRPLDPMASLSDSGFRCARSVEVWPDASVPAGR